MKLYYNLALLFFLDLSRIGGRVLIKFGLIGVIPLDSFKITHPTLLQRKGGHCLVDSLTGEVAC